MSLNREVREIRNQQAQDAVRSAESTAKDAQKTIDAAKLSTDESKRNGK